MTQFNTKLVHGPQLNVDQAGAIVPPVYQSAMFRFAPDGQETHWDYARSGNPTREYLERQIATLKMVMPALRFPAALQRLQRCSRFSPTTVTSLLVIRSTVAPIASSTSIFLNTA